MKVVPGVALSGDTSMTDGSSLVRRTVTPPWSRVPRVAAKVPYWSPAPTVSALRLKPGRGLTVTFTESGEASGAVVRT